MDRETLTAAIGRFPEKVPLRSRTLESVDCGSYRREKVEYDAGAWSRGAQNLFDTAQARFPADCLQVRIWPGGHGFTQPMRQESIPLP